MSNFVMNAANFLYSSKIIDYEHRIADPTENTIIKAKLEFFLHCRKQSSKGLN